MARSAGAIRPLHDGLQPFLQMGQSWRLDQCIQCVGGEIAGVHGVHRLLDHPRPPARLRRKKGGADHASGRSRGGLSTKINAVVDENGLPIRLSLSAGQASDKAAAPALIDSLTRARHVVADRGYDAMALVERVRSRGAEAHIPTQRDRKVQRSVDRAIYRQRNLVERYFNKLKHFKRIATRFEKPAVTYLSAVALASTRLWTRTYEATT